jgi:membrane-associated protease RseP (regulator of RpoE activity)
MNDQAAPMAAILVVMFIVLIFLAIWASLIVFGIKTAKKKNRSPHWMWFGIHPVGALVVFIVMMALDPLKVCPQCSQPSPHGARVCPYCAFTFGAVQATTPPTA